MGIPWGLFHPVMLTFDPNKPNGTSERSFLDFGVLDLLFIFHSWSQDLYLHSLWALHRSQAWPGWRFENGPLRKSTRNEGRSVVFQKEAPTKTTSNKEDHNIWESELDFFEGLVLCSFSLVGGVCVPKDTLYHFTGGWFGWFDAIAVR